MPGLRDLWGPGIVLEIENTKKKIRNFPSRIFLFMIVFLYICTQTHTHTHTKSVITFIVLLKSPKTIHRLIYI